MTVIYLIQQGDDGPVHLGLVKNPKAARNKIKAFQDANPTELHLRHLIDGDQLQERRLHVQFAGHRVRGDWYLPGILDELPGDLKYIDIDPNAAARADAASALADLAGPEA